MYSDQEKLVAVQMFIEAGYDAYAVKEKLGYPCELKLREWYLEIMGSKPPRRKRKDVFVYTPEEKEQAIQCFIRVGYSISRTISQLGYPSYDQLREWTRNVPRKTCSWASLSLKYTYEDKRAAVLRAYNGNETATAVAIAYGVSRSLILKWKHQVMEKEPEMSELLNRSQDPSESEIEFTEKAAAEPDEMEAAELAYEKRIMQERAALLRENIDLTKAKIDLQRQLLDLQEEVRRLQMEKDLLDKASELLKKAQGVNLEKRSNREKAILIDALRNKYMVKDLLRALSMSKSSYCYQRNAIRREDKYKALRDVIATVFEESRRTYGYRRIHALLRSSYGTVSEKVVRAIMGEAHLVAHTAKRRKYSSYMGEISPAVPNHINRDFKADAPNQKWLTDITEFHIPAGKVYLSPIIDCYDGKVVSWTIGTSPNAELVNNMLDEAIAGLKPDMHPIVHSDRGCHYRWPGWIERMDNAKLVRSMSKKGYSPDNSACEGFFGRLKNEFFYPYKWDRYTVSQFIEKLDAYIHWYNEKRIKVSLGGLSPVSYRNLKEGV